MDPRLHGQAVIGPLDTSLFDYELPAECIAQRPADRRQDARLLVLDRATGQIQHRHVRDLPERLGERDLLVLNDTRVLQARLLGTRCATGARCEVLFIRTARPGLWEVWLKTRGKVRAGEWLDMEDGRLRVRVHGPAEDGAWLVEPDSHEDPVTVLDRVGRPPLPPYIRRPRDAPSRPEDRQRYQTVYARRPGAIAAPTAGLHFTDDLLATLRDRGVEMAWVTLHVGVGTFKPIGTARIEDHHMHSELYDVPPETVEALTRARREGRRIVAVGTTTVRTLETVARRDPLVAGPGTTDLFIYPPYPFRLTDAVITNFHLPRSTLLVMVSALAGRETILNAYRDAVQRGYRFYSYGDAMLIE